MAKAKKTTNDIWESAQALAMAVLAMEALTMTQKKKRDIARGKKKVVVAEEEESISKKSIDTSDDEIKEVEEPLQDQRQTRSKAKKKLDLDNQEWITLSPIPATQIDVHQKDTV